MPMKFCVALPHSSELPYKSQAWERQVGGAQISQAMRLADELGYWKVMLGEHFIIPNEVRERSGSHYFQATTALAFVAGQTERIRLASSITLLPLLNPVVQAKMWATLDWLSGGRSAMVVGVGWLQKEFEILGVPFHERGRLCDEYLAAMHELWTSDDPRFEGRYVSFKDVDARPRPIQDPMPIWFGGEVDAVLKRVAKWGDGWSPSTTHPDQFPERIDFIKSQPDYHGRPIEVQFALSRLGVVHGSSSNDPASVGRQDAPYVLDQLGWLASKGVTEVRLAVPQFEDFQAYLDWLRWVAEEIMPKAG